MLRWGWGGAPRRGVIHLARRLLGVRSGVRSRVRPCRVLRLLLRRRRRSRAWDTRVDESESSGEADGANFWGGDGGGCGSGGEFVVHWVCGDVWSEGAPRKEKGAGKGGKQDSLTMPTFAPMVRTRLAVAVVDFARAFGRARARARVALATFSGLPCVSLVCRFRVHVHVRLCQLASPPLIFLPTFVIIRTSTSRAPPRRPTMPPVFAHHARIGGVLLRALKPGMPVSVWERRELVFEWG
jgi:hypothetical protein